MTKPFRFIPFPLYRKNTYFLPDLQDDSPNAWCIGCGMEVYETNQIFCTDCREEITNESQLQQSLSELLSRPLPQPVRQPPLRTLAAVVHCPLEPNATNSPKENG